LIYIFLRQQWKQCLDFALAKLEEICTYLAGACNSNSHARGHTILLLSAKNKEEKTNATRRAVLRKCIKRAQRYQFALKCEEVPLQLNSLHLPPKNHNLFVKFGTKRELEKKELRPQADNAQYNTQRGEGDVRREWEGGGGRRLLYTNLYMSRVKQYDNAHKLSTLIKKGIFTYVDLNPRDNRN
jgi:hypothetical protein